MTRSSSLSQRRQQIHGPDVMSAETRPHNFGQGVLSVHHRYFHQVLGVWRITTAVFQSPVLFSPIGVLGDSGDVVTELMAAVAVLRDSFELPELRELFRYTVVERPRCCPPSSVSLQCQGFWIRVDTSRCSARVAC